MKSAIKKSILVQILAILFLLFSCSKNESAKTVNSNELKGLPEWVLDPKIKDGVAAVGIASPSRGGIKVQMPNAEMDAKTNIAATIQSEVSRVTKNALRSAKVNENDDVEEFFSQATKEVVKNFPISGARRINVYQAEDGTLYVRMMIDGEDYSKFLKNSQNEIENKLSKSKLGRQNIDKSKEATKEMFEELEKERANGSAVQAKEDGIKTSEDNSSKTKNSEQ